MIPCSSFARRRPTPPYRDRRSAPAVDRAHGDVSILRPRHLILKSARAFSLPTALLMSGFKKIISKASRRTSKLLTPTSSIKSPSQEKHNGDGLPPPDAGPAEVTSQVDEPKPNGRERKPSFTEQRLSRKEDKEEENEAQTKAREQRRHNVWKEVRLPAASRVR